jgi:hypothetical protein
VKRLKAERMKVERMKAERLKVERLRVERQLPAPPQRRGTQPALRRRRSVG